MSDNRPIYHLDREREIVAELVEDAHGNELLLLIELRDLLDLCE